MVACLVSACGGDGERELVAVERSRYVALLAGPADRGATDKVVMSMRARSRAAVERDGENLLRQLDEWIDTLESIRPPQGAEEGHELLIAGAKHYREACEEALDEYSPELTDHELDKFLITLEREGRGPVVEAQRELIDAGFIPFG